MKKDPRGQKPNIKNKRLNNPQSCIVCARRAGAFAVGNGGRFGWFCEVCGPDLAWKAFSAVHMDDVEMRACKAVAEMALDGDPDLVIHAAELPDFLSWCIIRFADAMRKEFAS